jgi:hypothetical protein
VEKILSLVADVKASNLEAGNQSCKRKDNFKMDKIK